MVTRQESKLRRGIGAIQDLPWWLRVCLIVVASFAFIQAFGALSMVTLVPLKGLQDGGNSIHEIVGQNGVQTRFVRWDAGYYLDIVKNGYSTGSDSGAFYPLYPMLIIGLSWLTGLDALWSGLFVSLLCYLGASLWIYRWIAGEQPEVIADWTVLWLAVFPMTFFMVSFYAEPLLMLTTIGALYFLTRGNFLAGGICIALAGATRSQAIILVVPYAVEFILHHRYDLGACLRFIGGALIAPIGVVGFYLFLAVQAGTFDLLAVHLSTHHGWSEFSLTWPWITWLDGARSVLFGANIQPDWFSRALVIHDMLYAVFGVALAIWAVFHLRPSLAALMIAAMLFFSTNHGPFGYAFWSMPRHVASLVPIYLELALITQRLSSRWRWFPVAASCAMLALLSAWFVLGKWVS